MKGRLFIMASSTLLLLWASCGGTSGSGPITPATQPVPIERLSGETGVGVESTFSYDFEEETDCSTVNDDTCFITEAVNGCDSETQVESTITCSITGLEITPDNYLDYGEEYVICLLFLEDPVEATFTTEEADATYSVGGTVSGLDTGDSVVLQNSGADNLTVSTNGTFTFDTTLATGTVYLVAVSTAPTGKSCTVSSGSGTIVSANITDVTVVCATNTYSVGGTVSGLDTGESVVLQNSGADDLTVSANGAFTFATENADGSAYSVTVSTAPTGKTCTPSSSAGTISGADVDDVSVVCSIDRYTVGGTISGMGTGGEVDLQNNGGDDLNVTSNGSFTFSTSVAYGSGYAVTVSSHPTGYFCTVTSGTGTIAASNITNVAIECSELNPPEWITSVTTDVGASEGRKVSFDGSDNVYMAGIIRSNGTYNYGNGVTKTGAFNGDNLVLVKYNSDGDAQWAAAASTAPSYSIPTNSIYVTSAGNVYVPGYINGTGLYDFGNSVTPQGSSSNFNHLLIKYNSSGVAQWAKTISSGTGYHAFYGVVADGDENLYAAGTIGSVVYNFGDGVTESGPNATSNGVLVKYNSSGTAQWAQSLVSASNSSYYLNVGIDSDDNIYAVGQLGDNNLYDFGNSVQLTPLLDGATPVIVKYNSSGVAQWAVGVESASTGAFQDIIVDDNDNIYVVGRLNSASADYGNGVTATACYPNGVSVLVKYNTSGVPQWVAYPADCANYNSAMDVDYDSNGNIYVAGNLDASIEPADDIDFGNSVVYSPPVDEYNLFIVRYNSSGVAQQVRGVESASDLSIVMGIGVDSSDDVYATGNLDGTSEFDFGDSVTLTPKNAGENMFLLKYLE